MRFRWKDLSLKLLLFINLYPASRGPSEHCVMRQNWNNTRASNESSFETRKPSLKFWETSIFYTHHLKGFQETIYFSRYMTVTIRTYTECTDQRNLRLQFERKVKFKFLGDKKGPTKGFYLEVWKIDSVFLYQVYLLNYHNCFYICEGLYLWASHATA